MNNTVAIVGRPNVGKSTLFNALIGERKAIVDDTSGVTRDRIYGIGDWNGKWFNVIDTGGFVTHSDDLFESEIRKQVLIAVEEANLILFLVDTTVGITDLEMDLTDLLRKQSKPVLLVVNKVDNAQRAYQAAEFYSLGFENTFFISAMTRSGTGELLDEAVKHISDEPEIEDNRLPHLAIVGRPNAGKSSLVNILMNDERNIVTDIPGTTRDAIHSHYNQFGKEFIIIDTAGIRKKATVEEDLEFYSVIRAIKAIDEADVCVLVTDAQHPMEMQDVNIFSLITRKKKGVVIAVNKWDLIPKETNTMKETEQDIREAIVPFTDVPVIFTSVPEKQRIFKLVDKVFEVYENRKQQVDGNKLTEVIQKAVNYFQHPIVRGRSVEFSDVEQVKSRTPVFIFHTNLPNDIRDSYRQYLEKQIRKNFNFSGVPLQLFFRKK